MNNETQETSDMRNEFKYYLDHQAELLPQYSGKYLAIVGDQVVGAYTDQDEAYHTCRKQYGAGNFLIQLCTPGDSAYTIRFYSPINPFVERV